MAFPLLVDTVVDAAFPAAIKELTALTSWTRVTILLEKTRSREMMLNILTILSPMKTSVGYSSISAHRMKESVTHKHEGASSPWLRVL